MKNKTTLEEDINNFLRDVLAGNVENDKENDENNSGEIISESLILNASLLNDCANKILDIGKVGLTKVEGLKIMKEMVDITNLIDFNLLEKSKHIFDSEKFILDLSAVKRVKGILDDVDVKDLQILIDSLGNCIGDSYTEELEDLEESVEVNDNDVENKEIIEEDTYLLTLDDVEIEVNHTDKTISIKNSDSGVRYSININA